MDVFEALSALTTAPGVTGNEVAVSEVVKGYYKAYTDDIFIDPMGNTYARIGDHGPVLLVQAHMDEVGMMVTGIEKDGLLRIRSVSGVDPRVLPGTPYRLSNRAWYRRPPAEGAAELRRQRH